MEPVAEEETFSPPVSSDDEEVAAAVAKEEASADSNYAEEIAATEAAMAEEAQAEAPAAPVSEPEPPADVAETPAPTPPEAPPQAAIEPPAPPPAQPYRKLRLAVDTHFRFDRAELTPAGAAELDKLVGEMGAAQIGAITIVGYTDRIGPDAYNQKLSERRAASVKQHLLSRSVEADRMQAIGRGKNDPVTAPDACKGIKGKRLIKCLAPDRRVEVEVVGLATPAR
jgi:OOP family OmpA-OmpF porin